ncbi:MAG: type II secretion system protein [bacterium]
MNEASPRTFFFHKKKRGGFTILEICIVVGVALILCGVGIVIFNLFGSVEATFDATRIADIQALNRALLLYQKEKNTAFGVPMTVYVSFPDIYILIVVHILSLHFLKDGGMRVDIRHHIEISMGQGGYR